MLCPKSFVPREPRLPGTQMHGTIINNKIITERLVDTIKIGIDEFGLAYLYSDDPRAGWFEEGGVKPHPIAAKSVLIPLKWRTEDWKLIRSFGVMHPGVRPIPFLNPAIFEAENEFIGLIDNEVKRIVITTKAKYGLT